MNRLQINKKNVIVILIINLIIIIGMVYLLRNRYIQYRTTEKPGPENGEKYSVFPSTISKISITSLRNILFQYRSRKARNVSVIGDFNDWTPQSLTKEKNYVWKITMTLEPDKYLYNYLVDGKVILDPYNRKSEPNTSRGFKSSVLELKP